MFTPWHVTRKAVEQVHVRSVKGNCPEQKAKLGGAETFPYLIVQHGNCLDTIPVAAAK
jgi:hypothetical protein